MLQIVINIPEGAYNLLQNDGVDWLGAEHILNAVANGIVLPKGHGRLIDVSEYFKKEFGDAREFLDEATTIIEADKESEDMEVER